MDQTCPRGQLIPDISPTPLAPAKNANGRQKLILSSNLSPKTKNHAKNMAPGKPTAVFSSTKLFQNGSNSPTSPFKFGRPTSAKPSMTGNVANRRFFNSPTKALTKKSKSVGADNNTEPFQICKKETSNGSRSNSPQIFVSNESYQIVQAETPNSPQIFVSPPTPVTTSKFSRSISPPAPNDRKNVQIMKKSWQSIESLDRKSDVIPLNARRRSSSVPNALVKKEFSNYTVQIGVRIRPPFESQSLVRCSREFADAASNPEVVKINVPGLITVKNDDQELKFNFEHVFSNTNAADGLLNDQVKVYNEMGRPLVDAVLDGFNCCFLAYGQTGSGKTYSTMGPPSYPGVIPRFCHELFQRLECNTELNWLLEIGYYEIYNEKIRDLLITDVEHHSQLKVREHPESGPYIDGLGCFPVRTYEQVKSWMDFGNRQRATSATVKNDQSSRSHAIFMLKLTQKKAELIDGCPKEYTRSSCAYLVDLAGSERACTSNDLKETSSINKSLSCLGKVILQLAEKKQQYINYRDSILTWLLKEYLGGNSKTAMLITVSPCQSDVDESLSSLRYASQARAIVNRICVNEDPAIVIIKKLKVEMEALKKQLTDQSKRSSVNRQMDQNANDDVNFLKSKIDVLTQQLTDLDAKRREENESFERQLAEERQNLIKNSTSTLHASPDRGTLKLGRPYIALLSGDALVSSPVLYDFISNDKLVIGSDESCEIRLENASVPCNAGCVAFNGQYVTLIRRTDDDDVKLRVNGVDIENVKILKDSDYLNICNDYFLRVWYPQTSTDRLNVAAEYEKAKVQLLSIQNEKLHRELARRSEECKAAQEKFLKQCLLDKETEIEKNKTVYNVKISELERLLEEEKSLAKISSVESEQIINRRSSLLIEANEAKQEYEESISYRSELLIEIENLCKKYSPQPFIYKSAQRRRSSLMTIDQLVVEANMFLKDWRKQFDFSYEECLDDQDNPKEIMVRLTNTKMAIFTLLTVPEFRKRLELLRSLYESGSVTATNLEKILMNSKDNWEYVNVHQEDSLFPLAFANNLKKLRRSSTLAGSGRRSLSMSPTTLRRNSFVLNTTLSQNSFLAQIAERPQMESFKLVATLLQAGLKTDKCSQIENVFDNILDACNDAIKSVKALADDENLDSAIDFGSNLLRCYWSFTSYGQVFGNFDDFGTVRNDFIDKLDVTASTIRLIFKTMDIDMLHVRQNLSIRLKENLNDVCNLVGSVSALWTSKLVVHCLSSCTNCKIDADLIENFINGFCDTLLLKRNRILSQMIHFEIELLSADKLQIYRCVEDCFKCISELISTIKNAKNFNLLDEVGFVLYRIFHPFTLRIAKLSTGDRNFFAVLAKDVNSFVNNLDTAKTIFKSENDFAIFIKRLHSLDLIISR